MSSQSPFQVRASAIHGRGVFARRSIAVGQRLGRYEGRRLSPAQVESLAWDSSLTCLFGLSDGTVIDGGVNGNAFRHLNHSCSPNCEAVEEWDDAHRLVLEIVVIRAVEAGEELCIDYALSIDASQSPDQYRCACDAVDCKGSMAAVA